MGRRMGAVSAVVALGISGTVTAATTASAAPAATTVSAVAAHAADVDYATWQVDVKAALAGAQPYLQQRTANATGQQLAIVRNGPHPRPQRDEFGVIRADRFLEPR